jgi:hypothetical protein
VPAAGQPSYNEAGELLDEDGPVPPPPASELEAARALVEQAWLAGIDYDPAAIGC